MADTPSQAESSSLQSISAAAQLKLAEELDQRLQDISGKDSSGRHYFSVSELWKTQFDSAKDTAPKMFATDEAATEDITVTRKWYANGADYWENDEVPASIDGVLGGFGHTSDDEVHESRLFIEQLFADYPDFTHSTAVDCGAGIGRVAQYLLSPLFDDVHCVEQSPRLIHTAQHSFVTRSNVTKFICCGLQDFVPEEQQYDLVWVQWVIGHLTDSDLITFLQRCVHGLKPGGFICFKENIVKNKGFWFDLDDWSIIRSDEYFRAIFDMAGLKVVATDQQKRWPAGMYPVFMYALKAKE